MDRATTLRPQWSRGPGPQHKQGPGHVESYFLKWNDTAQQRAVWLKFTFLVPLPGSPLKQPVGEVWAIWFDNRHPSQIQAWKESFPLDTCQIQAAPLLIQMGHNQLHEQASQGALHNAQGRIRWNVQWDQGADALAHFPHDWMYRASLPKSKLTAPSPSSRFTGWIELNGERIDVDQCPGTLGHNWGQEHAWHYAWGHCNAFEGQGPDTWFEGASSRLRWGRWTSPYLNIAHLHVDGRHYAFNRLRHITSGATTCSETAWRFRMESDQFALIGHLSAPSDRFICLRYNNPDGALGYCLNSKLADAELTLQDRHGRTLVHLQCQAAAALEVLIRDQPTQLVCAA